MHFEWGKIEFLLHYEGIELIFKLLIWPAYQQNTVCLHQPTEPTLKQV